MTSRAKKRIVLPSRPEPPSIEQILEDVRGAVASDPVFVCDDDTLLPTNDMSKEREQQYVQSCSYVEMNSKLKESQAQLKGKCHSLRCAGQKLEGIIEELKVTAM
ncbi:UPF0449 protein C19orf25 homolog [Pelodytes ibericus]